MSTEQDEPGDGAPPPLLPPVVHPRQVVFALGPGFAGGAVFAWLGMPLAWMLGAMTVVTIMTMSGAQVTIWPWLRTVMIAVLGIMLGSAFTPEIMAQLVTWLPSVLALIVFITLTTTVAFNYFRRVAGFDPITAYFCSVPGGLSEMAIMGAEYGADIRKISLVHATRILLVVSIIPFYFRFVQGADVPPMPANVTSLIDLPFAEAIVLGLCGLAGVPVARWLKVPAAALVGPMILSAGVHLAGFSETAPPRELIAVAQVVIGTSIGCRFAGLEFSVARRVIYQGAGSGLIMIVLAVVAAMLFAGPLGRDAEGLTLAFAPGGLAEMSLIALSIGIDTAFVSSMHILRIIAVVMGAPMAFKIGRSRIAPDP